MRGSRRSSSTGIDRPFLEILHGLLGPGSKYRDIQRDAILKGQLDELRIASTLGKELGLELPPRPSPLSVVRGEEPRHEGEVRAALPKGVEEGPSLLDAPVLRPLPGREAGVGGGDARCLLDDGSLVALGAHLPVDLLGRPAGADGQSGLLDDDLAVDHLDEGS